LDANSDDEGSGPARPATARTVVSALALACVLSAFAVGLGTLATRGVGAHERPTPGGPAPAARPLGPNSVQTAAADAATGRGDSARATSEFLRDEAPTAGGEGGRAAESQLDGGAPPAAQVALKAPASAIPHPDLGSILHPSFPRPSPAPPAPRREDGPAGGLAPEPPPEAAAPPPPARPGGPGWGAAAPGSQRIRVRTESGKTTVAKVYGRGRGRVAVLLPDGQIRFAGSLVYTDEPFRPATADELEEELHAGPFAAFSVIRTAHYLVFYQSSQKFAEDSAKLLEELYKGLREALGKREIATHEAEFPLVAVIYRTEREFRARDRVPPQVKAYYEILTNQIHFFERSEREHLNPEAAKLLRPQTVAHEGTHQILANIGVEPRLADWPLWLTEGLAEYCSPPVSTRKGFVWKGLGVVNPLHMATIKDLEDPLSTQVPGVDGPRVGREPGTPLVEYLVTRTELSPTDYALAWAMTHYLAMKRGDAFVAFLKKMSRMLPMEEKSPEDQLSAFRAAFGKDLAKLDKSIATHLGKLKYEQLPYYAVVFEQPMGGGRVKRGAIVSQSPSLILQWVQNITSPDGGVPSWQPFPHPTKARAILAAEGWLRNR
jgi:hypothetical protein